MNRFDAVLDGLDGAGLGVMRAWPREAGHLLLDLASPGGLVAGQWFEDAERARHTARATARTAAAAQDVTVVPCPVGAVLVQARGADRRLPALAPLVATGALVAHRPERRAVVRHTAPDGRTAYTKLVRPGRSPGTSTPVAGLRTPTTTLADCARGVFTSTALPGRSLHDLTADPAVPASLVQRAFVATGAALATLHASTVPPGAPVHDAAAELAVLVRWAGWARAYGLPGPADRLDKAGALLVQPAAAGLVLVHRDLHDKQVVVADDGSVGLLDFDLSAAGEPALDVANLLVHLELRAHQGHLPVDLARSCADAFLAGYRPGPAVYERIPAYALATRLRLVAVYGFRPAGRAAAAALLEGVADA